MDKIMSGVVYIVKDVGRLTFDVCAGKVIGYYESAGEIEAYMVQLQDTDEIINVPCYDIFNSLSDAQKEARRLSSNATLFRLVFC